MARAVSTIAVLAIATTFNAGRLHAQPGFDPVAAMTAQKEAMKPLAVLDGVWRGPASTRLPTGENHRVTQTERVGPFLDGAVKVMEGRGYDADGKVTFNAFGTISFNPATQKYSLRTYAMGRAGDFPLTVKADGFIWEIPAGPMTIRYTATIKDGTWNEIGEYIVAGKEPDRFMEMNLKRIGDTKWPAEGTIPHK